MFLSLFSVIISFIIRSLLFSCSSFLYVDNTVLLQDSCPCICSMFFDRPKPGKASSVWHYFLSILNDVSCSFDFWYTQPIQTSIAKDYTTKPLRCICWTHNCVGTGMFFQGSHPGSTSNRTSTQWCKQFFRSLIYSTFIVDLWLYYLPSLKENGGHFEPYLTSCQSIPVTFEIPQYAVLPSNMDPYNPEVEEKSKEETKIYSRLVVILLTKLEGKRWGVWTIFDSLPQHSWNIWNTPVCTTTIKYGPIQARSRRKKQRRNKNLL